MNKAETIHQIGAQATIGQIVSAIDSAGRLLHSIGLKYEDHQDKTLRQVCSELHWNEEEVIHWIKQKNSGTDPGIRHEIELPKQVNTYSPAEKSAHIGKTYHRAIFELLNEIDKTLSRIHQMHGIQDPTLEFVKQEFDLLSERLTLYLKFQQNRFFRQIEKCEAQRNEASDGVVQGLKKSIGIIRNDQIELLKRMDTIERVTRHFLLPERACSLHRMMINSLEELAGKVKEMFVKIESDLSQPIMKRFI